MNPEIDSKTIDQLIDENLLSFQDFYFRVFSWVKENYSLFYESKVDIKKFVEVIGYYAHFHKKFADISDKVGALIDLDKIMEVERYEVEKEV